MQMQKSVSEIIAQSREEQLSYLDLSGLGLESLPFEILDLPWIRALSLSHNRLSDISLLEYLPNLHKLALSDNRIEDIGVLKMLPKLRFLFLAQNQVYQTQALTSLSELKKLILSQNHLNTLPNFSQMKHLVYLDIYQNPLEMPNYEQIKALIPGLKIYKY